MVFPQFLVQHNHRLDFYGSDLPRITWYSDLTLPIYTSFVSAVILFCQAIIELNVFKLLLAQLGIRSKNDIGSSSINVSSAGYIEAHGGRVILAAQSLTLVGSLELLRVSLWRYFVLEAGEKDHSFIVFGYTSVLALFVLLHPRSTTVSRHVTLVLVTSWLVYFIRHVVPLLTYTESPADVPYMIWELIGVLSLTGVILPLITPRQYIPLDASDPMPANPEQTASWLSLLLFFFVDRIVWKAYRSPHLPLSELPPLADSDHSKNLVHTAFPHLDPFRKGHAIKQRRKQRHLFFAVASVFRKDLTLIALLILVNAATILLLPYSLKRLLEYLGTGGKGATVKPWVWIASLFLAPFGSTLVMQQYQVVIARATVHLEAIFTQLILQHALRIRVVAEGKSELTNSSRSSTVVSIVEAGSSTLAPSDGGDVEVNEPPLNSMKASFEVPNAEAGKSLVGRMNNLISSDLQAISKASEFMQVLFAAPLVITLTIGFLYTILGWSALVGALVLLVQMPIPVTLSHMLQGTVREASKKSDDRIETVTETMSVIRMIKMFGWESKMSGLIDERRDVELSWVWWNRVYSLGTSSFHFVTPAVTMSITFSVYALIMGRTLDAATVFSSITLFDILRYRMMRIFLLLPLVIRGNVSLSRISDFLHNTELLDEFTENHQDALPVSGFDDEIGFRAATFAWSNDETSGTLTPSKRRFRLRIDEELIFQHGRINLIVGPTGSGKTSLLMALLGEMHFIRSGPDAWFNLPRTRGVAYAAQESWVMNATIKENILFNSPYDEERYSKVIDQCGLIRDLELFKAGDHTEIGEKGLTLSGGQKARITLARAVYSSAEILLLDDVLAALDVHTAKWIVEKCFTGDLVQGRTVLLVTHNVKLAGPISDFVVSLSSDGRIISRGSMSDALAKDSRLESQVANDAEKMEKAEEVMDVEQEADIKKKAEGKLIVEEESGEGHIGWDSVKMYFVALGGNHWIFFWTAFTAATLFECVIEVLQPWLLGKWTTQYESHPPQEVNVAFYLTGYVGLVVLMLLVYFCAQATLTLGALRASASLHKRLIDTILGATLRWLDKTPTSRIITRVTQDVAAVDTILPELFSSMFEIAAILIVRFFTFLFYAPSVSLYAFVILAIGAIVGNVYMKSQLSVKREMSKAKAPVMAHFGASLEGITSIRAYGVQKMILQDFHAKVDNYSRASRVFNDLSRWIAIRIDALGGLYAAFLGLYFVYAPNTGVSTANSALALSLSVGFGRMILEFVQMFNMFEVNGNSLERIQEYSIIEQEPKPHAGGVPPAHWPSTGALRVEKLVARYSLDGSAVLHSISFDVRSGERIGIVGRTGSGKSSLTLALLRFIVTEGDVWYDGINTKDLNLAELRERVTIIPQVPELLSGSLRRNLDPFDRFDDATLNAALRDSGLYSLQEEDNEARLSLDSAIARGGSNLSVGQRQIIALARAMVRESKLLILDEATSAIDYKTDAIIQGSLRTQLGKDVTVMTVAHRLQTIMDADRIMVLDAGNIVEFDKPQTLLQQDGSFFRALVDESGDRQNLYAMAAASSQNNATDTSL